MSIKYYDHFKVKLLKLINQNPPDETKTKSKIKIRGMGKNLFSLYVNKCMHGHPLIFKNGIPFCVTCDEEINLYQIRSRFDSWLINRKAMARRGVKIESFREYAKGFCGEERL